ncbi:MAG: hypothetical protein K2L10_08880 [Ruminococcus sp.]|nr:hypothetical protein [Ruminococcus sp.]
MEKIVFIGGVGPLYSYKMIESTGIFGKTTVVLERMPSINQYKNCLNEAWQTGVEYWEHPKKSNYMISQKQYKDYLIREMMSEIMEFVSENMALEKFVVTLMSSKKTKGDVSVKIEDVNVGTKFSGYVDTQYMYTLENVPKAKHAKGVPIWLNAFPNIVSAVKHGVGSMETTEKVEAGVTFGLSGADVAKASFGAYKSMTFYIYFKRK